MVHIQWNLCGAMVDQLLRGTPSRGSQAAGSAMVASATLKPFHPGIHSNLGPSLLDTTGRQKKGV